MSQQARHRIARNGYSLLELVLAIALAGGTLTPALVLMRRGMEVSRSTDQQLLLTNYAIAKLEERMADVAANWILSPDLKDTGDMSADGFDWIRYTITSSHASVDGGIEDNLMSITVTTYADLDANDALSAGEPSCTFRSKVANLYSYVQAAGS